MSETLLGSEGSPAPQASEDAGSVTPTPASAPESTPAPEPAPAPSSDDWMKGFEGEDLGWLQNRGLQGKSIDDAFKNIFTAARNAEKKLGVPSDRLLQLPADRTSEGAMDSVYKALGKPDAPGGYEIDRGDDEVSERFADTLQDAFFKSGLNKEQSDTVYAALEDFLTTEHDNEVGATQTARAAAFTGLQEEWGDTFDVNLEIAKEAAGAVGATKAEIDALASAFDPETGDADVIRFFNRIGQKRGVESPFIDGDNNLLGLGATTPEAAAAKIAELKADAEWRTKFRDQQHNPDSAIMKQYRQLVKLAAKQPRGA